MTNDNNTTRKKANAVFFAAVMVVSMVAVGFAAAPAAAAVGDTTSASANNVGNGLDETVQTTSVDIEMDSDETRNVTIDASDLRDEGASVEDVEADTSTPNADVSAAGINSDGDVEIEITTESGFGANSDVTVDADLTLDTSDADSATGVEYAFEGEGATAAAATNTFDLYESGVQSVSLASASDADLVEQSGDLTQTQNVDIGVPNDGDNQVTVDISEALDAGLQLDDGASDVSTSNVPGARRARLLTNRSTTNANSTVATRYVAESDESVPSKPGPEIGLNTSPTATPSRRAIDPTNFGVISG